MNLTLRNPVRGEGYSNQYETPPALFRLCVSLFGPFGLDVCAAAETAKCKRYFTAKDSCLNHSWGPFWDLTGSFCGDTRQTWRTNAWLNPPYSEGSGIGEIIGRARTAADDDVTSTLALFPAKKSEQSWYQEHVAGAATLIMPVSGRIAFLLNGETQTQPNHASVLVWWLRIGLRPHGALLAQTVPFDQRTGIAPRYLAAIDNMQLRGRG